MWANKRPTHKYCLPSNPFHYDIQGISTCKVVFIREPIHGSIGLHQYGMQYYCQSVSGAQWWRKVPRSDGEGNECMPTTHRKFNALRTLLKTFLDRAPCCWRSIAVQTRAAMTCLKYISYVMQFLCHNMTICHDMRFISEISTSHCMTKLESLFQYSDSRFLARQDKNKSGQIVFFRWSQCLRVYILDTCTPGHVKWLSDADFQPMAKFQLASWNGRCEYIHSCNKAVVFPTRAYSIVGGWAPSVLGLRV